jgi:hypothetical protein
MDPANIEWVISQLDKALASARRLKRVVGVKSGIGQFFKKMV